MKTLEKISVALTPQMVEIIREAVDSGQYASAGEVIREALRLWRARQLADGIVSLPSSREERD